jgi:hypothetical protein
MPSFEETLWVFFAVAIAVVLLVFWAAEYKRPVDSGGPLRENRATQFSPNININNARA